MILIIKLVVLMLVIFLPPSTMTQTCDEYHFFNLETSECTRCKTCRQFEVLFSECAKFNNSVCISLNYKNTSHLLQYISSVEFWFDKLPKDSNRNTKYKGQDTTIQVPGTKVNIANWKTLSYSLTGVLGLLGVVSTLVLLYLWRRRQNSMKEYDNLQNRLGNAELGNEYVVFRRLPHHTSYDEEDVSALLPRPPIRGCRVIDINVRKYSRYYRKRLYKPQRRLLPEGVDDVFESEDSAGSRSLRLHTIPERSDSDIDEVLNADKKLSHDSDKDTNNDESVNEVCCVNSGNMSSSSKSSKSSIEGSQKAENDKSGSYVCLIETEVKDSGSDVKNTPDSNQNDHNTETENRKHSSISAQEKEDTSEDLDHGTNE